MAGLQQQRALIPDFGFTLISLSQSEADSHSEEWRMRKVYTCGDSGKMGKFYLRMIQTHSGQFNSKPEKDKTQSEL